MEMFNNSNFSFQAALLAYQDPIVNFPTTGTFSWDSLI
jgi:hypothetical protein